MAIRVAGPMPTSYIFECLDLTEYNALGATSKEVLRMLLSCATVDLSEGNPSRTTLDTLFPAGVTHTALLDIYPDL